MTILQRSVRYATFIGLGVVAVTAYAQVGTINSVIMQPRVFNDIPGALVTSLDNYPSLILFEERGVSAPAGFANRDVWQFSSDGGATAFALNNNEYFRVSMTLSLTGTPTAPRKEAGFLFNTIGGQGQFIVNTDAHEVVAFGGPLPFYAFPATYNSGDSITLGMTYFKDGNGKNAIIYSANGVNSPVFEFGNLEQGIITGSTLGGYFQIVNDPINPGNGGFSVFSSISIVPEPSALALLGLGLLPLVFRRRR
jgi:hypothetical protein